MNENPDHAATVFHQAGGAPAFERMVERFYDAVENDPLLRPMYPADLTEPKRHLALFLMQYFDGPRTYSDERGHPRLRLRHVPFRIGQQERDAWLRHMTAAVEAENLPEPIRTQMLEYFESTSTFLMNQPGPLRLV